MMNTLKKITHGVIASILGLMTLTGSYTNVVWFANHAIGFDNVYVILVAAIAAIATAVAVVEAVYSWYQKTFS